MSKLVTVEVAFATDPGAAPTWTDISGYLREITITRGRQRELDQFSAGRAVIVLANEDRRFDPAYASSPYSPNVIPMRRVRVRVTYNGVTYDLFSGFADGWGQTYQHPQEARCTLSATDAFAFLANIELPMSVWEAEMRNDTPRAWYRFGDPSGSLTIRDNTTNELHATNTPGTVSGGLMTLGTTSLTLRDPDTAATIPYPDNPTIAVPSGASVASNAWSVEYWIRYLGFPVAGPVIYNQGDIGAGNAGVRIQLNAANQVEVRENDGATADIADGSTVLAANTTYHVVVTRAAGAVPKIYVNGVADTVTPIGSNWPSITAPPASVAHVPYTLAGLPNAIVDEFILYTTELSSARVAAHYAAGAQAWVADKTGARIGRILDVAGWPAADRNIDTGQSTLQSSDLGGSALEALWKVAETEQGLLFITGDGKVRFIARDSLLTAPYTTSQATFGDSGSELDYETIAIDPGTATLIYNEARVSRSGGTVQVVSDAASVTKYLRRTRVLDGLLHDSDATSRDLANWVVGHYKDPITRIAGLEIRPPLDEANLYPQALGRELGDRVTVRRRPQNLGAAIEQAALIEGIEHRITAADWVTKWNLSPAETAVYWILGVAGASELGETSRLAF